MNPTTLLIIEELALAALMGFLYLRYERRVFHHEARRPMDGKGLEAAGMAARIKRVRRHYVAFAHLRHGRRLEELRRGPHVREVRRLAYFRREKAGEDSASDGEPPLLQ
ncbi:MAG: hypothetical protein EXS35_13840 [Pedosphaera sp.]|nr:hypothetical protein [Pedosphaera sp.]